MEESHADLYLSISVYVFLVKIKHVIIEDYFYYLIIVIVTVKI